MNAFNAMSAAARSIFVYAIYVFGLGATLLLVPNIPLPIFGLPQASEVWIRVAIPPSNQTSRCSSRT